MIRHTTLVSSSDFPFTPCPSVFATSDRGVNVKCQNETKVIGWQAA